MHNNLHRCASENFGILAIPCTSPHTSFTFNPPKKNSVFISSWIQERERRFHQKSNFWVASLFYICLLFNRTVSCSRWGVLSTALTPFLGAKLARVMYFPGARVLRVPTYSTQSTQNLWEAALHLWLCYLLLLCIWPLSTYHTSHQLVCEAQNRKDWWRSSFSRTGSTYTMRWARCTTQGPD